MEDLPGLLAGYPAPVPTAAADVAAGAGSAVFVVLDDDPTGTQSVAGLPVLTSWTEDDFDWAFGTGSPAVYVLTNSRSLAGQDAARINREVVAGAHAAAVRRGVQLAFVSRSDSTLRGHYPLETDVLAEAMAEAGMPSPDAVVMVPAFPDANRVTIGSVHYLRSGDSLQPIAETEFARDATFGYSSSSLPGYVEEKTAGRISAGEVLSLTLDIIRGGPEKTAAALSSARNSQPVAVDAVSEDDLRLLALGLQRAEAAGKTFLYRVGPPFVRAAIGQEQHAPLTAREVYGAGHRTAAAAA
ncbi:four-carbon acid sugar kinase family protein [Arthrobacter sp. ATA002]|uniref:four-carbon acid sugar kinase family protein n=1 Tax=Arthrobacter sp. ATA002 TaxID=2991715 RepID=UPI002E35D154|nr:four-carbon acid sugar kinase family protein [Arthrobacter sp. ATA002]